MSTPNATARLLTPAFLAIVSAAILISSLQEKSASYGNRRIAQATKDYTVEQTGNQGQYNGAWQRLKSKSEAQIRENDSRISKFKAQRASAGSTFRATYDRRVAELQRRNATLEGRLNDYKGDRRDTVAEFKWMVPGAPLFGSLVIP
jgi:hypothetical protein